MIPSTSTDDLIAAMELFDQEGREADDWQGWEQNQSHKYAIEHNGQFYPVKEIISLATQIPVSDFSGGEEANAFVKGYGFDIVSLSDTPVRDRDSPAIAKTVFERMFPLSEQRRFCLTILADSLTAAAAIGAGKWSVSLTREVNINVGRVVVCAVRAKGVWLALDNDALSEEVRTTLKGRLGEEWYKSLPSNTGLNIPPDASADLVAMVWDAHLAFLRRAATPVHQVNSRSQAAHSPGVLTYLRTELNRDIPSLVFLTSPQPVDPYSKTLRSIWWVNQGTSYANGLKNHSLWAPLKGEGGRRFPHWERMREVKQGDLIVHYGTGAIRAISRVNRDALDAKRPPDHPTSSGSSPWEDDGTFVDTDYFELQKPILLAEISPAIAALTITYGPLNKVGGVNQGYLYRLNDAALDIIRTASSDAWPEWAQPITTSLQSWIFQGTPTRFDAAAAVNDLQKLTWRVTQHVAEVHIGDEVFLWMTGADASLIAWATVLTEPEYIPMADVEAPYVKDPDLSKNDVRRVWLAIKDVVKPPILRQTLLADPALNIPIFKGWQGTNYKLKKNEADAVRNLFSPTPASENIPMTYTALLSTLRDEGLYFSEELVSNYLLALQTKRFVILSGISGTGKTQLALAVARYYRKKEQVIVEKSVPGGAVRLTVYPYCLKYQRVMLPVHFASKLQLPPLKDNKSGRIQVYYPGGNEDQGIYVDTRQGSVATELLFSKGVWKWFKSNLKETDHFFVDIIPTEDGPDALQIELSEKIGTEFEVRDTYANIAVRPDWTDNRALLGYYNPIIMQYHATPFLKILLEAAQEETSAVRENRVPHPYFVILDEMNLARVEHYFSDFLSCLESGEALHLHDSPVVDAEEDQISPPIPQMLPIPNNVFFTGTVNVDETTSMFSPKVVDRAFTLEFNSVDLLGYGKPDSTRMDDQKSPLELTTMPAPLRYRGNSSAEDWQALGTRDAASQATIIALHQVLSKYNRHFGYRVANEIARFLNLATEQASDTPDVRKVALDLAILQKVLPKFHGTQQELQMVLGLLFSFAIAGQANKVLAADWQLSEGALISLTTPTGTPVLPRSAAKLWRMLERLQEQGFTSFME